MYDAAASCASSQAVEDGNAVDGGEALYDSGRDRATYSRSSKKSSIALKPWEAQAASLGSNAWFQARPRDIDDIAGKKDGDIV